MEVSIANSPLVGSGSEVGRQIVRAMVNGVIDGGYRLAAANFARAPARVKSLNEDCEARVVRGITGNNPPVDGRVRGSLFKYGNSGCGSG